MSLYKNASSNVRTISRSSDRTGEYIERHEPEIRNMLKAKYEKNSFSIAGSSTRFRNTRKRLKEVGWKKTVRDEALHTGWGSLDLERKSCACVFEQYRTRMWVQTLEPIVRARKGSKYLVTIANQKWQLSEDALEASAVQKVKAKIKDGIRKLHKMGREPLGVVMLEVSSSKGLDDNNCWEPHCHILIAGCRRRDLRSAFAVRQPANTRGKYKPLQIKKIDDSEIARTLGYLTKMKGEFRSSYQVDGKTRRRSNKLTGELLVEWTAFMATLRVVEVIHHIGFEPKIVSDFERREFASVVKGFLKDGALVPQ